jgi:hypothetical protein
MVTTAVMILSEHLVHHDVNLENCRFCDIHRFGDGNAVTAVMVISSPIGLDVDFFVKVRINSYCLSNIGSESFLFKSYTQNSRNLMLASKKLL